MKLKPQTKLILLNMGNMLCAVAYMIVTILFSNNVLGTNSYNILSYSLFAVSTALCLFNTYVAIKIMTICKKPAYLIDIFTNLSILCLFITTAFLG